MKLASIFFAAASAAIAVSAQSTAPPGVGTVSAATDAPAPSSVAPAPTTAATTTDTTGGGASTASGEDILATYKASPTTDSYHMAPVRVVHARVQSDTPILVKGQLVSSFGGGDLDAGYLSSLDSTNTASVEGALMYVQAETINVATRDASLRCERKTTVRNVIFYEILIAQTNETIAQFQDSWATPEYGPMIAMDGGRCTPTEGADKLPVECYQFSGENKQPNLGPFVGGTNKELSDRAPYPGNYWFSFPNTCPTQPWGKTKTTDCREKTRKGLCPLGVAPNGVDCTFAYNILGWVPIDDIVGITSIVDESTQKPYKNFTTWCKASEEHIEFSYDLSSKTVKTSLPFWKDPLNTTANAERAKKMLAAYDVVLAKGSTQVNATLSAAFKPLPTPEALAKANPPCYKTVKSCGSGAGCKRVGYSQLCTPCSAAEKCATSESGFTFPTLTKAPTTLSEAETKGNATLSNDNSTPSSSSGSKNGTSTDKSSAAHVSVAFATVAASLLLSLAL